MAKERTSPAGRVVAVTGASEYLGRRLVEYLRAQPDYRKVCVIDVREPACATGPKTVFCPVDLTMPEAGRELAGIFKKHKVDILVHLAFLSHPLQDVSYAHELQVIGTLHLLNGASAARVMKVIMLGDTKSYGARPDNPNFLSESDPLRGVSHSPLVSDLVEVEKQLAEFTRKHPRATCTVLRMGNILSREVDGFIPRLLAGQTVPVVMGYDPLMQFLHHDDALAAIKLAVAGDHPGAYNITAEGVLPLSTAIRMGGRLCLPIPHCLWERFGSLLWAFQVQDIPPSLLPYLRYLFVADGEKARRQLGFVPTHSSREILIEFYRQGRLQHTGLPSQE